jgi:hypothetical protein
VQAAERVTFDPYAAVESVVPADVLQLLRRRLPSATLVSRSDEWHQDELESQFSLMLAPAPTAVRSCLLHSFDAHRRHHTATTAVATIPCVANAEWHRLLRYFGDHVTLRFGPDGHKLTFPVVVAFAPPIYAPRSAVTRSGLFCALACSHSTPLAVSCASSATSKLPWTTSSWCLTPRTVNLYNTCPDWRALARSQQRSARDDRK